MPSLRVRDAELWHEVRGEGPRVLFVAGTGSDLRRGPTVLDGPLPRAATVLAYDHRGLGRSDAPDRPPTMADFADDAAGLLDALGWGAVPVIGVSFGGMVAQELALRHPDRVTRLVLCCTSSGGAGGASYPLHELTALPPPERARRVLSLSDERWDDAWQAAHPQEVERAEAALVDTPGARRQLEARARHDTWDRLPQIGVPTLVCAGRRDGIAPLANSEALAARIPGAQLQVFDGGHLFLLQDRSAWPAITAWLLDGGA